MNDLSTPRPPDFLGGQFFLNSPPVEGRARRAGRVYMKRLFIFVFSIFICESFAFAHTISWYVGDSVYTTTTCSAGDSITPPTAPEKLGYDFVEWAPYKARLEYLESTGKQYINTGYYPNQGTGVKTKLKLLSLNNREAMFFVGSTDSGYSAFESFYWNNRLHFREDRQTLDLEQLNLGDILEINWNKNTITYYVNDNIRPQVTINFDNFSSINSLHIMHTNRITSLPEMGIIRLYYFQIYDNDVLVRDMIPVLDKNGVPCMYDKVTKQYFYNQGTGNFIAGPVISE